MEDITVVSKLEKYQWPLEALSLEHLVENY